MSEKFEVFERCNIWAMFISPGPPLLRAEPSTVAQNELYIIFED